MGGRCGHPVVVSLGGSGEPGRGGVVTDTVEVVAVGAVVD